MLINQATFDPFDAPIQDVYDYCQQLPEEFRFS